uniref:Uncharacterized protein n=1 Tax=Megaselia scalaris TaxID=36166 RepID=T1GF60_MEGSC
MGRHAHFLFSSKYKIKFKVGVGMPPYNTTMHKNKTNNILFDLDKNDLDIQFRPLYDIVVVIDVGELDALSRLVQS